MSIRIKNRIIGNNYPVYIIAEMSANHAGDFEIAKKIIVAAKNAGADCIKLQTYTADTMTIDSGKEYFQIKNGTWKGENLYKLYQKAFTPWEWQLELKKEAERIGLDFFSTPFDESSVDFLEGLNVEFYKIASFEITDLPLLSYIASKQKPIIMSTGMATTHEIQEAIKTIKAEGNSEICLLNCSSTYPANLEELNLLTIQDLKSRYQLPVGFSDHSLGDIGTLTAVALGACIIEKHFCLSRTITTPDSSFSMEPSEFKRMVDNVRAVEKARGKVSYELSPREKESRKYRRSIFAVKDIQMGDLFTSENVQIIRPAQGLPPREILNVLHKRAKKILREAPQ